MPTLPGGPGNGRYLIRARDDEATALIEFLGEISADPAITTVDVIGPKERPHTAVIDMSHDKARALAQRFETSRQLMIEPDRPVSLF